MTYDIIEHIIEKNKISICGMIKNFLLLWND